MSTGRSSSPPSNRRRAVSSGRATARRTARSSSRTSIPVLNDSLRNPRVGIGRSEVTNLALDGTFFFVADDGSTGLELWKSDGTDAGTLLVKDINPGPGS